MGAGFPPCLAALWKTQTPRPPLLTIRGFITNAKLKSDIFNGSDSSCVRLRDSPLLEQIREAFLYGEQYYGSNSKNLQIMA